MIDGIAHVHEDAVERFRQARASRTDSRSSRGNPRSGQTLTTLIPSV